MIYPWIVRDNSPYINEPFVIIVCFRMYAMTFILKIYSNILFTMNIIKLFFTINKFSVYEEKNEYNFSYVGVS